MEIVITGRKENRKPRIWIHPVSGELRYPMADEPMPLRYKMQGYEERVFESYFEHQRWCKDKGLINHAAEGVADHEDVLGRRNRWGY